MILLLIPRLLLNCVDIFSHVCICDAEPLFLVFSALQAFGCGGVNILILGKKGNPHEGAGKLGDFIRCKGLDYYFVFLFCCMEGYRTIPPPA